MVNDAGEILFDTSDPEDDISYANFLVAGVIIDGVMLTFCCDGWGDADFFAHREDIWTAFGYSRIGSFYYAGSSSESSWVVVDGLSYSQVPPRNEDNGYWPVSPEIEVRSF